MSHAHSQRGAPQSMRRGPVNHGGQRRLTVFVPLATSEGSVDTHHRQPRQSRATPTWRQLPYNPFVVAETGETSEGHSGPYSCSGTSPSQRLPLKRHQTTAAAAAGAVLSPDGYAFYCDPCQKGFRAKEAYDVHMAKHMYCTVPGCGFTCKVDKAWKMEAHMDLLHNRPDAPSLADPEKYLAQRRQRFPTLENVHQKVEELYYKAARGVVMPDERRRWMRQHGIHIGKRFRSENTYIARGTLPTEAEEKRVKADEETAQEGAGEKRTDVTPKRSGSAGSSYSGKASSYAYSSSSSSSRSSPASSRASSRPAVPQPAAATDKNVNSSSTATTTVPLLPIVDASLMSIPRSAAARVALATERRVPRFYVCNRCGEKGAHWVNDCPTAGDPTYNRHLVWGEARRPPPPQQQQPQHQEKSDDHSQASSSSAPPASKAEDHHSQHREADEEEEVGDDGPPPAVCARIEAAEETAKAPSQPRTQEPPVTAAVAAVEPEDGAPRRPREVTKVLAPVAAARLAAAFGRGGGGGRGRGRHAGLRQPEGPPPPSLYEKLTEEDRLNEDGLLLQAVRFFVARNFFQP